MAEEVKAGIISALAPISPCNAYTMEEFSLGQSRKWNPQSDHSSPEQANGRKPRAPIVNRPEVALSRGENLINPV